MGHRIINSAQPDDPRSGPRVVPVGRSLLVGAVLAFLSVALIAPPALAHGGQSATEGYVMVQQAISYLVNEPGPKGTAEAMVRIDNALAAEDQDGVNVSKVEEAKADLTAGKPDDARSVLQDSISEAIASLSPATGYETGTTTVVPPFHGNGSLSGLNWVLLILSVLVALGGGGLAYLFRPKESLRALGDDIRAARNPADNTISFASNGGDHHVN